MYYLGAIPWVTIRRSDLGSNSRNGVKKLDENENPMLNADGSATEEQNEGSGIDQANPEAANETAAGGNGEDPYSVKKRLGMQAKKHAREMRQMQEQLAQLQSQMFNPNQTSYHQEPQNPFPSPGQPSAPGDAEEDRIRRAVTYALQAKEQEAQKAKQMEQAQHVQKQYQRLNNELDKGSDKYDDFDDVVRGNDVPFTQSIRDALLLVDNPADVAYKLGKNRDELSRISQLHPVDQAREVNKLSFALMGGNSGKSASNSTNPMSSPKPNPTSASGAAGNKTASSIRAQLKAGTWK